jgi:dienelactone hydrolase
MLKSAQVGIACFVALTAVWYTDGSKQAIGKETTAAETRGAYGGDAKLELQPAHALWREYDPNSAEYAFRAKNLEEARCWQERTRAALSETMGFQTEPKVDPKPVLLEKVDKGDYIREKLLIRTAPQTTVPVYVLLPRQAARPLPVVVALHGHGYGVKSIVGIREDGIERSEPEGYQKDFAVKLCRRGFAVAAPEISCFGERQTDFSHLDKELGQEAPKSCAHTAALASHLGRSVLGLRVLDVRRLIDYLQSREEMDTSRLGAMGISGGGMLTFFTAALDKRIKVCVISGYFCTFKDSILAVRHCACNYVHGLGRFGEMSDIVGLIAPRPILIEAGTRDKIFPIKAVRKSVTQAREVYKVFGAEEQVETDYFEGKHEISGKRAYDFLMEKLARQMLLPDKSS